MLICKSKNLIDKMKKLLYRDTIKIKDKNVGELEKYVHDNICEMFILDEPNIDKEIEFNHLYMLFERFINIYGLKIYSNDKLVSRLNVFCILAIFIDGFKYINETISKDLFISKLRFIVDDYLNSDPEYISISQKFEEKQVEFVHNNIVDLTDIKNAYKKYYDNDRHFVAALDKKLFDDKIVNSAINTINFNAFETNNIQLIKELFVKITTILLCKKYMSNNKFGFIRCDDIEGSIVILRINFEANINWALCLQKSNVDLQLNVFFGSSRKYHLLDEIDVKDINSHVILR